MRPWLSAAGAGLVAAGTLYGASTLLPDPTPASRFGCGGGAPPPRFLDPPLATVCEPAQPGQPLAADNYQNGWGVCEDGRTVRWYTPRRVVIQGAEIPVQAVVRGQEVQVQVAAPLLDGPTQIYTQDQAWIDRAVAICAPPRGGARLIYEKFIRCRDGFEVTVEDVPT